MFDISHLLPSDLLLLGWRLRWVESQYELSAADVVLPWSRRLPWLIHLARVWSGLASWRKVTAMMRDGDYFQAPLAEHYRSKE